MYGTRRRRAGGVVKILSGRGAPGGRKHGYTFRNCTHFHVSGGLPCITLRGCNGRFHRDSKGVRILLTQHHRSSEPRVRGSSPLGRAVSVPSCGTMRSDAASCKLARKSRFFAGLAMVSRSRSFIVLPPSSVQFGADSFERLAAHGGCLFGCDQ